MDKDLFGKPVKKRKSRLERSLEKSDRDMFSSRLYRLKWLESVFPKGSGFLMPPETFYVFEEARLAFINGEFVATLLLANAFLEQWLGNVLASKGYEKEAGRGLSAILKCMAKTGLLHPFLADAADRLRKVRNPFVHIKSFNHEHRLTQRMFREKRYPNSLLEEDAKDAISLMLQVATTI
jgi:hypothetical protein